MDGNVLPSKLLTRLSKAADIVRSHNFIQVYSHYDADGLSAAGIIGNILLRADKEFRITTQNPRRQTPKETVSALTWW